MFLNKKEKEIYAPGIIGKTAAFIFGAVVGACAALIMLPSRTFVIILSAASAAAAVPIAVKTVSRKRREKVRRQFKDFLESLCSAFSGGCNALEAFGRAFTDLKFSCGEKGLLVREIGSVLKETENGRGLGEALADSARRLDDTSFYQFAETFGVCLKKGGNLREVAAECRDIIDRKIDAEREIALCIASNRNELNVLTAMPFVITLLMKDFGFGVMDGVSAAVSTSRIAALIIVAISYYIGFRITDIGV